MADHNGWRKHATTRRQGHSQFPRGVKPLIVGHLRREAITIRETDREINGSRRTAAAADRSTE